MLDFEKFARLYSDKLTSLRQTSLDVTSDEYLTDLDIQVYNFDDIKEAYVSDVRVSLSSIASTFRSNDALYNKNGKLIFIKFKNGCITSGRAKEEIRSKISESLLILSDILDSTLKEIRNICYYVLVYNKEKNELFENQRRYPTYLLGNRLAHLAGANFLINGFDRYRVFFHEVYTINENELENVLNNL